MNEYEKILNNLGYNLFIPQNGSVEDNTLEKLRFIINNFTKTLDIDIQIEISIINNASINASVFKSEGTYYLSLFRGVITELKDFVLNFVIGHFPFEYFNKTFGNTKYKPKFSITNFFDESETEHYTIANIIADNMLFYIVYHEIGHILAGHQEVGNKRNELHIEYCNSRKGSLLSQAKEFMADFYGLINSVAVYNDHHHDTIEEFYYYKTCYIISLYSLLTYFASNNKHRTVFEIGSYDNLCFESHPVPAIRLVYMMGLLNTEPRHSLINVYKVPWANNENIDEIIRELTWMLNFAVIEY